MNHRIVGTLFVREGAYAVQFQVAYQLGTGIQLIPFPVFSGDVLRPDLLMLDAITMSAIGVLPEGVHAYHAVQP